MPQLDSDPAAERALNKACEGDSGMQVLRLTDGDMEAIKNALANTALACRRDAERTLNMHARIRGALIESAEAYEALSDKLGDADRVLYEG